MTDISTSHEKPSDYVIPILGTFPGMNPAIIEAFAPEGTQALILESNGHAAPANTLLPKIKEVIDRGIPVIALADNYGEAHGITHVADQPQQDFLDAGGFYLETIGIGSPNADDGNQQNLSRIIGAIKEGVDQGLHGQSLGAHVRDRFAYPEDEKPPRPDPFEAMRAQHQKLLAQGLGGLPISALERLEALEATRK